MPTPNLDSQYITFNLGDDDTLTFTYEQRAHLQNMLVELVQQRMQLDPKQSEEGKQTYWQHEAYLRGQYDLLSFLLTTDTK